MEYYFLMRKGITKSNEKNPQVEGFQVLAANYCLNIFECNQAGRTFL